MAQTNMRRIREDASFRNLNDDLIYEFFAVFSRFEYALKNGGYLSVWTVSTRSGEKKENHGPDWRKFARHTERDYQRAICNSQSESYQATAYILDQPPKLEVVIQTADGNKSPEVDFRESPPRIGSDWSNIIEYANRVRNNLFHGGKYKGDPYDPTRDEDLLNNTLTILRTCVIWRPRVRDLYRELK